MAKKKYEVDNETGEIIEKRKPKTTIAMTLESYKNIENYYEKMENIKNFYAFQSEYLGRFVFLIHKNMDKLSSILTDGELVKYIYIGTFTKKDRLLMLDDNKTIITKNMMKKMLKTGDNVFYPFFNKCIEHNLMFEVEDKIYMNFDYFFTGNKEEYELTNSEKLEQYTRLYTISTRALYETTKGKTKDSLAIAYKLLPKVNWRYNILCYNPEETDTELVKPFTIGDVMKMLGYDKSHLARFKKKFYGVNFLDYSVFASVQKAPEYQDSIILVNPLVYYGGNDFKHIQYLGNLFGILKN